MEDWTPPELAAALRAEIERDGVPVNIPDDELLWAAFSPLVAARRRILEAVAALREPAERATCAIEALNAAFQRSEDFEEMLADVRNLPECPEPTR